MKAFADAVCLRAVSFGARVLDVVDREVQLIIMPLWTATKLGATVRQDAQQTYASDLPASAERGHSAGLPQCLDRIKVVGRDFAVSINEGLLINAPDSLDRADVVGVLGSQIAWMLGLDLAVGLVC